MKQTLHQHPPRKVQRSATDFTLFQEPKVVGSSPAGRNKYLISTSSIILSGGRNMEATGVRQSMKSSSWAMLMDGAINPMLMDEAINRGYATTNPTRKLHIEKAAPWRHG